MNIHQLSVSYLHEQDRILVRINSADAKEIRLWLTRRLCLSWAPVLRQTLETASHHPANPTLATEKSQPAAWVGEFQRLQHLKDSDFLTPFKSDAQSWPLGSEPLLVTTVHLAPGSDGGVEFRFEECLQGNQAHERSFHAAMAPKLVHGFVHLIEQALEVSQWEPMESPGQIHSIANEADDHVPRETPRYLH